MARIHTDLQTGALGAAIDADDTLITFAAAPDFPTLAPGDIAAITLVNTDDYSLSEIVHLTAYTAGDLTGAIARAQEGPAPAAAWAAGTRWDHAPTADDFSVNMSAPLTLEGNPATDPAVNLAVTGEAFDRWAMDLRGFMSMGDGTEAPSRSLHFTGHASRDFSDTFLGWKAGNAFVGSDSLAYANTGIGHRALALIVGDVAQEGHGNTALGYEAGGNTTTGKSNVFLGVQAKASSATNDDCVVVGYHATAGGQGVSIGAYAGDSSTGGGVFVGHSAGEKASGGNNVAVGNSAGQRITTGTLNTLIGSRAGGTGAVTNLTGQANVVAGYEAGKSLTGADYNLLLGYTAGQNITTGDENIVVGRGAGGITTGSHNCIIGNSRTVPDGTASGQLNFCGVITGTGLNATPSLTIVPTGGSLGFYGTAGIAKQTGVAVTATGIHAALVALGLIAA